MGRQAQGAINKGTGRGAPVRDRISSEAAFQTIILILFFPPEADQPLAEILILNHMYRESFWAGVVGGGFMGLIMIPLIIWSLIWKGMALWKAARNGSKGWFVALLIVNTLGILDILYIYVFGKKAEKAPETPIK